MAFLYRGTSYFRPLRVYLTVYREQDTGLRVVFIKPDKRISDSALTYRLAVGTLPESCVGFPHIVEHVVLSNSKKYRFSGELFLSLIDHTLALVINASTSLDMTQYYFITDNYKDFLNLFDVYTSCVLDPNLEDEIHILVESFHRIYKDKRLHYKGVIFNEMKESVGDPRYIQWIKTISYLVFNQPGDINSFGDPLCMVRNLTPKDVVRYYKRFYTPTNMVLWIYGNFDYYKRLRLLNTIELYLKKSTASRSLQDKPHLIKHSDVPFKKLTFRYQQRNKEDKPILLYVKVLAPRDLKELISIASVAGVLDKIFNSTSSYFYRNKRRLRYSSEIYSEVAIIGGKLLFLIGANSVYDDKKAFRELYDFILESKKHINKKDIVYAKRDLLQVDPTAFYRGSEIPKVLNRFLTYYDADDKDYLYTMDRAVKAVKNVTVEKVHELVDQILDKSKNSLLLLGYPDKNVRDRYLKKLEKIREKEEKNLDEKKRKELSQLATKIDSFINRSVRSNLPYVDIKGIKPYGYVLDMVSTQKVGKFLTHVVDVGDTDIGFLDIYLPLSLTKKDLPFYRIYRAVQLNSNFYDKKMAEAKTSLFSRLYTMDVRLLLYKGIPLIHFKYKAHINDFKRILRFIEKYWGKENFSYNRLRYKWFLDYFKSKLPQDDDFYYQYARALSHAMWQKDSVLSALFYKQDVEEHRKLLVDLVVNKKKAYERLVDKIIPLRRCIVGEPLFVVASSNLVKRFDLSEWITRFVDIVSSSSAKISFKVRSPLPQKSKIIVADLVGEYFVESLSVKKLDITDKIAFLLHTQHAKSNWFKLVRLNFSAYGGQVGADYLIPSGLLLTRDVYRISSVSLLFKEGIFPIQQYLSKIVSSVDSEEFKKMQIQTARSLIPIDSPSHRIKVVNNLLLKYIPFDEFVEYFRRFQTIGLKDYLKYVKDVTSFPPSTKVAVVSPQNVEKVKEALVRLDGGKEPEIIDLTVKK